MGMFLKKLFRKKTIVNTLSSYCFVRCNPCNKRFSLDIKNHPGKGTLIAFCPYCRKFMKSYCEYGFGPIEPCDIFVGEEAVATLIKSEDIYYIKSDNYKINHPLEKGYSNCECYDEAIEYIENWLTHTETEMQHYVYR